MKLRPVLALALLAPLSAPLRADDGDDGARLCQYCRAAQSSAIDSSGDNRPLEVEIVSGLQFSRLAMAGNREGTAAIDPQTGARSIGAGLIDLGGMTFEGRVKITGMPGRAVRIILPEEVTMTTTSGGQAKLIDIALDGPVIAQLDGNGERQFAFGGKIVIEPGVGGTLRGRIPITVDYN